MNGKSKPPLRIVSLAPSATSILCAIGARKLLVGVTKWCPQVAPVGKLRQLGDCWHMGDIQEITDLRPSLVIGSVPYHSETVAKLLEQPISFLAMNPRTLADIENDVEMLGRIAARTNSALRIIRKMRTEFAAILLRSQRTKRRLRVYCEAWPNPRISSPPWVAELVEIAGGTMVVPAGQRVSEENVANAAPQLVVLAWAATGDKSDPEKVYAVKEWSGIPAVRMKQVHVVRDEWLNTPGPPLLKGARELARIIASAKFSAKERR
jgi:iron complex transport system substrate-binding protein